MSAQRWIAHALETGALSRVPGARLGGLAYGYLSGRRLAKPLDLPRGARVIGIGGATLGGSGKTVLAEVVAEIHRARGARVAILGHGYRSSASRGSPHTVSSRAQVGAVGDEALLLAKRFEGTSVDVVVGGDRSEAMRFAREDLGAEVLVLDGVLQASPRRLDLSLLAVSAATPWGAGQSPPAGDLCAPVPALLNAADHVVRVGAAEDAQGGLFVALVESFVPGRLGLLTALARPDRIAVRLRASGCDLRQIFSAPDHGPVDARLLARVRRHASEVDAWVATEKCACHFPAVIAGLPVVVLRACPMPSPELSRLLGASAAASVLSCAARGDDVAYVAP